MIPRIAITITTVEAGSRRGPGPVDRLGHDLRLGVEPGAVGKGDRDEEIVSVLDEREAARICDWDWSDRLAVAEDLKAGGVR
jgi:hypothetical protein